MGTGGTKRAEDLFLRRASRLGSPVSQHHALGYSALKREVRFRGSSGGPSQMFMLVAPEGQTAEEDEQDTCGYQLVKAVSAHCLKDLVYLRVGGI
jgi:hypothetical protein